MKKFSAPLLFVVLLFACLPGSLWSQTTTTIADTEASQHVGQKVAVEGVVVTVTNSGKGNTFINFGGKYPKIKITGTVELYKGKPKIKIMSKDQLVPE